MHWIAPPEMAATIKLCAYCEFTAQQHMSSYVRL